MDTFIIINIFLCFTAVTATISCPNELERKIYAKDVYSNNILCDDGGNGYYCKKLHDIVCELTKVHKKGICYHAKCYWKHPWILLDIDARVPRKVTAEQKEEYSVIFVTVDVANRNGIFFLVAILFLTGAFCGGVDGDSSCGIIISAILAAICLFGNSDGKSDHED